MTRAAAIETLVANLGIGCLSTSSDHYDLHTAWHWPARPGRRAQQVVIRISRTAGWSIGAGSAGRWCEATDEDGEGPHADQILAVARLGGLIP